MYCVIYYNCRHTFVPYCEILRARVTSCLCFCDERAVRRSVMVDRWLSTPPGAVSSLSCQRRSERPSHTAPRPDSESWRPDVCPHPDTWTPRIIIPSRTFVLWLWLGFRLIKTVKVAHTRLPSVGFRSWSRFFAVSLQVTWVINPAVGCHYFPPLTVTL